MNFEELEVTIFEALEHQFKFEIAMNNYLQSTFELLQPKKISDILELIQNSSNKPLHVAFTIGDGSIENELFRLLHLVDTMTEASLLWTVTIELNRIISCK